MVGRLLILLIDDNPEEESKVSGWRIRVLDPTTDYEQHSVEITKDWLRIVS
jgi:hypothetical protein